MKLTFLSSSTVIVESNNTKILMDPWLLDGEYYGSWFHYPKFNINSKLLDTCDYIYVSHIHPDHFSRKSFNILDKNIPVLIHNYESKFLKINIEKLGFNVIELDNKIEYNLNDKFKIRIYAADNCNPELCSKFFGCSMVENKFQSTQIDSMALLYDEDYSILNTNDCPFELAKDTINEIMNFKSNIDLLLVGYAGAGPYPQCFVMDEKEKIVEAKKKEDQFLKQGIEYINTINPRFFLPFAGTYVLGGKLSKLNKYRGVPDIENAFDFLNKHSREKSEGVLLTQYQTFDLSNEKKYKSINNNENHDSTCNKEDYIDSEISKYKLDYESDPEPQLNDLLELIPFAFKRFKNKKDEIKFISKTQLCIDLPEKKILCISLDSTCDYKIIEESDFETIHDFVKISTDFRLLYRILKGPKYAHWNNAEIGSHLKFERNPNIFERGLYHSYCYFHA